MYGGAAGNCPTHSHMITNYTDMELSSHLDFLA